MHALNPLTVPPVGEVRIAAVHVNVTPEVTLDVRLIFVVAPLQIELIAAVAMTSGLGLTFTVAFCG